MELGESLTDKDRQWVLFDIKTKGKGDLKPFNDAYRNLNRRLAEVHDQMVIRLRDEYGPW